ncbi:hypothetical protein [Aneurinibacillus migulanus]|uniref:hypothetical protein n=1 Tax=Aneurinibacillus migulanus TaxID=47500 RepID=UPI0006975CBC|nr:hypothetical protein [Aneurinibacillus migulanus]MCP1355134.1 hypothetical protein [Aneurinibacillus migulanus]CEH31767.1 Uncharacterized protein BN1090_A2_04258 [Aneurinibacillus migulanus]
MELPFDISFLWMMFWISTFVAGCFAIIRAGKAYHPSIAGVVPAESESGSCIGARAIVRRFLCMRRKCPAKESSSGDEEPPSFLKKADRYAYSGKEKINARFITTNYGGFGSIAYPLVSSGTGLGNCRPVAYVVRSATAVSV